jgi:cysteine-rich repeat protein
MLASGRAGVHAVALGVACAFLVVPHAARGWQARVTDSGTSAAAALAVAVDGAGDVLAGGYTGAGMAGTQFAVVKLAGSTGQERWRRVLLSTDLTVTNAAMAVLVDRTTNDVVAVGQTSADAGRQVTVVRLAATTGAILWRRDFPGTLDGRRGAPAALDSAGDVVVVGMIVDTNKPEFTIVKLTGATGGDIWRAKPMGVLFLPGSLAVTSTDDVVVMANGQLFTGMFPPTELGIVLRLDKSTGGELWRYTDKGDLVSDYSVVLGPFDDPVLTSSIIHMNVIGLVADAGYLVHLASDGHPLWSRLTGVPERVAVLGSGDIVLVEERLEATGRSPSTTHYTLIGFGVVDISGTNGADRWRRDFDGGPGTTVTPLLPGGLFAAGEASGSSGVRRFIGVRLAGADGAEMWRRIDDGRTAVLGGFQARSSTVGPSGEVVVGGSVGAGPVVFSVLRFDGASGALDACGDGIRDAGEQCDDGNVADGDCCSNACQTSGSDGLACQDSDVCTTDGVCRGGSCVGHGVVPCEPCGVCDPGLGCLATPSDCRVPGETQGATVDLRRGRARRTDALSWTWSSTAGTVKADLGDPRAATGYALCLYRDNGLDQAVTPLVAPAGGRCGGTKCWRATARGFEYRDPALTPTGIAGASLRARHGGRARIHVWGSGGRLGLPELPLSTPKITIQLKRTDTAICWGADETVVARNRHNRFTAKSN